MRVLVALALVAALPGVASAGNGKKLFPLVPDDAQGVAVIDVASVRGSDVFQKLVTFAGGSNTISQMTTAGIGPSDVDTVLLVIGADQSPELAIAEGNFTAAQVDQVGAALGDTKQTHKGITYWAGTSHEVALIGKRLVIGKTGQVLAAIGRTKKHSLAKSSKAAGLRAAIALTDTRHDIWMAGAAPSFLGGAQNASTPMSVGISLGSDVIVQLKIQAPDATTAVTLGQQLQKMVTYGQTMLQSAGLTGLASSLTVNVDDRVVQVDADLPGSELDTFVKLVASFI